MNNYLIEGIDYLTISDKIAEITQKNNFYEVPVNNYDMEESSLDNALEDLDTYSFLQEKKVIVISNFDSLKLEENEKKVNHLIKYLQNPLESNLLFITCKKLDDRRKANKELKKLLNYEKIEINSSNYIKQQLKSYELENGVLDLINELCQNDISKIKNECQKLKNYKISEKVITKEDVNNLVSKKLSQLNELSFSLIRQLAEKNKSMALKTYNELLEYQFEPLAIIGLLESQFRIMYQIKVLEKERLNNDEIAQKLGEKSSYRIKKVKELTRFYNKNEILDILIRLADIDYKIKTTNTDSTFLLQLFILNM